MSTQLQFFFSSDHNSNSHSQSHIHPSSPSKPLRLPSTLKPHSASLLIFQRITQLTIKHNEVQHQRHCRGSPCCWCLCLRKFMPSAMSSSSLTNSTCSKPKRHSPLLARAQALATRSRRTSISFSTTTEEMVAVKPSAVHHSTSSSAEPSSQRPSPMSAVSSLVH